MKKISIVFLFFLLCFDVQTFGQYTVKIRIGDIYSTREGWAIAVSYADVFDGNGNLISPYDLPSGTTYLWEREHCEDGYGFLPWEGQTPGFYPTVKLSTK